MDFINQICIHEMKRGYKTNANYCFGLDVLFPQYCIGYQSTVGNEISSPSVFPVKVIFKKKISCATPVWAPIIKAALAVFQCSLQWP